MERIISLEQEPKLTRNVSICGLNFEIKTTEARQIQYISRACFPLAKFQKEQASDPIRITGVKKEFENFNQLPKPLVSQGSQFYGRTEKGVEFTGSTNSGYCVISENPNTHLCIGPRPEYSAVSLIKLHLLKEYSRKYDIVKIFHAGMVVDTGSGIVFSSPDNGEPEKRRFGKTSITMALCSHPDSKFSFYSNDEVVLGIDGNGLNILPFPNEILIRQITIDSSLKDKKPGFEDWIEVNKDTGNITRTTTPVGLVKADIKTQIPQRINQWVFLNMSPNTEPNTARKLEKQEALTLFRQSVFNRRMRQMEKTPIGVLEQDQLYQEFIVDENYQTGVETLFENMLNAGVTFWEMQGGFDSSEIHKTVVSLKNK